MWMYTFVSNCFKSLQNISNRFIKVMNKTDKNHKSIRARKRSNKNANYSFTKALLKMAPKVTRLDKELFVQKYGCSLSTISRYLNGKVADDNRASKMLVHFSKCIDKRNKVLQ
jgi:hypothetical protein